MNRVFTVVYNTEFLSRTTPITMRPTFFPEPGTSREIPPGITKTRLGYYTVVFANTENFHVIQFIQQRQPASRALEIRLEAPCCCFAPSSRGHTCGGLHNFGYNSVHYKTDNRQSMFSIISALKRWRWWGRFHNQFGLSIWRTGVRFAHGRSCTISVDVINTISRVICTNCGV